MPEINWAEQIGKRARGKAIGYEIWIEAKIQRISATDDSILIGDNYAGNDGFWCNASTCTLLDEPKPKTADEKAIYKCPYCSYRITDTQRKYARIDYLCPRCGEATFSKFLRVDLPKKPKPIPKGKVDGLYTDLSSRSDI